MTMYLVLSAVTSSPISVIVTAKASALLMVIIIIN